MNKAEEPQSSKPLSDEYGNMHHLADELARGGQGVVFRTKDADLAVKQPLDSSGQPDKNANLRDRFQEIRELPMPSRIPVSLPLAILRDEPGYVMRLLSGMKPFSVFDLDGRTKKELEDQKPALPQWLAGIPDNEMALRLFHYSNTGSTRRRLFALSKCASILARLHSAGLVYGDISTNNAFIGEASSRDVWLIDADNMRFEQLSGGISVYTPGYGAPEVVRVTDSTRPRSDCWAFAVMAFKTLALCHPFIGKKVLEPDVDEGRWDAEPVSDSAPADLDEQAYAGYLPFVDDEDDNSNQGIGGLPRELVATPRLRLLFQETFGVGRELPHRRPAMGFWALELAKTFDHSLECTKCKMSFFADNHKNCPYCGAPHPAFIRARTPRWEVLIPDSATEFVLPHRLFHPFSFEHNDDTECEAVLDFAAKTAFSFRGTKTFPENLTFDFVEAGK
jgi:serine/threonine protein kinase